MRLFISVASISLILDQGTKFLAQRFMYEGQSIPVIEDIFHLTYILNPGAAFGILANKTTFFIFITLFVLGLIVYFYRMTPKEQWFLRLGLALQAGGAMGNLIDRIRIGKVVDFFDFRIWPIFNIADIAIVSGVIILFIEIIRSDKKEVA